MASASLVAVAVGISAPYGQAVAQDNSAPSQPGTQMPPVVIQATPWVSQDERRGQEGYIQKSTPTATKTNTPLLDIPQSITVITKDFIKDQNITSIEDAVRYVPGVIPHQGESNRDDLVIRGQRSNADFFVNGIRDDVQYYRDLYNLQSMEVLKGPNAMIFGRGGGGGVVNRVLKEADGTRVREFTAGGNTYPGFRISGDIGEALNDIVAVRLNAFYEKSSSYRNYVNLERYGFNPTMTIAPTSATSIKLSYEYLHDWRNTDRGIPSQVRPGGVLPQYPFYTSAGSYFGNPGLNYAVTTANIADAVIDHDFGNGITIRNASRFSSFTKFYQNVYPGSAVNLAGNMTLSAYNNETDRQSFFNQTDVTSKFATGFAHHTLVTGAELGRQTGLSYRLDGYFNGNPAQASLPISAYNPVSYNMVTFRNTTGANNTYRLDLWALYAQDQIELTPWLQFIGGVRFDQFNFQSQDQRTSVITARIDNLWSPRAGFVVKPIANLAFYGSYSVSYLPSVGDQFSTLAPGTAISAPEKFENKEIGVKWDILPKLQATAAIYELNRTNQRLPDPNNPGFFIASGSTNTKGFELGLSGYITDQWQVMGGYAYTDAHITGATSTTVLPGNRVGLVPSNVFTLWNRYQITPNWGAGIGMITQSDSFASSDNTVLLPGWARFDGGIYYKLTDKLSAAFTVENIFGANYISTADGNNNITPGSPTVFRLSITPKF